MANIKKLKANGQDIVPITHEQAVLDSNGVTLDSKLNAINNAISRLENNSTSNTPSLVGNALTFGNYTIKYNETDDTLDFIYNGATDVPTTEEVVSVTWIDNKNINYSGAENDDTSAMVTDYLTKENGYNYTINLTDVSSVKIYFFDSSKTFISRTNNLTVNSTDILIEFPENTSYFRIKSDKGTATVDNANNYIILKKNESDVPTTEEVVSVTWIDGKSVSGSTGEIIANEVGMLSDPIAIDNNYNYTIRYNPTTTNEVRIVSYDSSQTFISRSGFLTSGNVDTVITFPQNTAYFRIKAEKVGITVNEANDNIIIKKVKKTNTYVTNGLSLYIDAQDVATQGSIRDITGNHTITNHGVTHTSDNNYLNFVASESDYLDTDFIPNLTQWSAELYFYFTSTPTNSQSLCCWGVNGNKVKIYYSGSKGGISVQTNNNEVILITNSNLLAPHHLIVTMNNGVLISYLDGVKIQLPNYATVQTSHTGTLKIGTKYDAIEEFINMNLRMFRFYDGKVLTDEEALQNYNYEINKNENIIKPTWIYNKKPDSSTGQLVTNEGNACTELIAYDSSYNYTLAIDTVQFVRVFYYDSSQSYIKNDSIADNFNGMITPPENTAYMRLKVARKTVEFADLDNHVIFRKTHK